MIPDRWLNYSKMGAVIEGTRLLPIKVPLKDSYTKNLPKDDWFSPTEVLKLLQSKNITPGLVIDLSFTTKYYFPEDFTKHQIGYTKIYMPGRKIPERSIVQHFFDVIEQFEKSNADNRKVILVHCTHGLNRTGYMICKYLTECKKMSADYAIDRFNIARGHKIEREIYLNDLRNPTKSNNEDKYQKRYYNVPNQRTINLPFEGACFAPWNQTFPSQGCSNPFQFAPTPNRYLAVEECYYRNEGSRRTSTNWQYGNHSVRRFDDRYPHSCNVMHSSNYRNRQINPESRRSVDYRYKNHFRYRPYNK